MTEAWHALVGDIMTKQVVTVNRNSDALDADQVMNLGRIRHVLVVDDDDLLVGVVSQRDLFHSGVIRALGFGSFAKQKALDTLLVKEVMTSNPLTTTAKTPLKEAAQLMLEHKVGCLPVLESQKLIGIITESDFVKLHAQ
jgi:CBS domain-containing protein